MGRLVAIALASSALVLASVTAAEANLTPVTYQGRNLSEASALRYLYGARPSDAALRSVYFSRADGVLTIRMSVNRIDPYKSFSGGRSREASAVIDLVANGRRVGTILVNNRVFPGIARSGGAGFTCGDAPERAIRGGINYRTNMYVVRLPLTQVARCGARHGQLVSLSGKSEIFTWVQPGVYGGWTSYFRGPEFSFRY